MKTNGFYEYVKNDVLVDISGISSRAMFGGFSFYRDGVIFGMVVGDKLYFKIGPDNKGDYEAKGMGPFTYRAKNGNNVAMKYYEVPEDILESRSDLPEWLEKAVEASKKK